MELVPRLRRVGGTLGRALRRRQCDLHERLGLRSERVRAEETREVLGVRAKEIGEAVPVRAARKSGAAAADDRRRGPGRRRSDHGIRIGPLRVALVTTHLALRAVAAALTREVLRETLRIVSADLRAKFAIAHPRIAVCGLNPHAGEGGYLGREEIDIIEPELAQLRAEGLDVDGPLPADTVFVPARSSRYDCIAAMYHDQGLPVLKAASFGHGVNVTLGLPIVRTSVDHGTALDLAADGASARAADPGSLFAAVELGIELANARISS